jgi:hypothetical protein
VFAAILQASEISSKVSCRLCTAEVRGSNPASPTLTQRQSFLTCDSDDVSSVRLTLLIGRLQWHVSRQGGDPVQPSAHHRVGFEVESPLRGDRRVNVEGDVGHCWAISDEELAVA